MENRTEGGCAVAAICAFAILLLLVGGGGVGIYYVVRQRQMELAIQAERAAAAEAEARLQVERSLAYAEAAAATLRAASDDSPSPVANHDTIRTEVEVILRAQEKAWNQGDLDEFMKHYWQSESLTFSSEGKTTRGGPKPCSAIVSDIPRGRRWATSN